MDKDKKIMMKQSQNTYVLNLIEINLSTYLTVLLPALPLALSSFKLLLFSELSIVGLHAGRVPSLCTEGIVVVAVTGVNGLLMAPLYMPRNDEATADVDVVSIA